jgi:hypothetical protein
MLSLTKWRVQQPRAGERSRGRGSPVTVRITRLGRLRVSRCLKRHEMLGDTDRNTHALPHAPLSTPLSARASDGAPTNLDVGRSAATARGGHPLPCAPPTTPLHLRTTSVEPPSPGLIQLSWVQQGRACPPHPSARRARSPTHRNRARGCSIPSSRTRWRRAPSEWCHALTATRHKGTPLGQTVVSCKDFKRIERVPRTHER